MSSSIYSVDLDPSDSDDPIAENATAAPEAVGQEKKEAPQAPVYQSETAEKTGKSKNKKGGLRLYILLAAAAAAVGWYLLGSSGGIDEQDLAFLPDNPNVIVQFRPQEFANSELVGQLKSLVQQTASDLGAADQLKLSNQLAENAEYILVGVTAPRAGQSPGEGLASGVIRFSSEMEIASHIPAPYRSMLTKEKLASGQEIMAFEDGAFSQIDERTVAFGNTKGLKTTLARDSAPANLTEAMTGALKDADLSSMLTVVAAGAPDSVKPMQAMLGFNFPEAVVFNVDADADIQLAANLVMKDSADVKKVEERMRPLMDLAKLQSPQAAEILDTLEFAASGSSLTVSATVPGAPLVEAAKQQTTQLAGLPLGAFSGGGFSSSPLAMANLPAGGPRLPLPGGFNRAKATVCQQRTDQLNIAIERFNIETGEWPAQLDQLTRFLPEGVPDLCPLHDLAYVIDPETHRVREVDPEEALAMAAAAESKQQGEITAVAEVQAQSPEQAFEAVVAAAADSDLRRLLTGFTEAAQVDIVDELTNLAMQDVAIHSRSFPEVSDEFAKLDSEQAAAEDDGSTENGDVVYLRRIAEFMIEHEIEFAQLGVLYEPYTLGEVFTDQNWALAVADCDKDGTSTQVFLGFAIDDGSWKICTVDEIPGHVLPGLKSELQAAAAP